MIDIRKLNKSKMYMLVIVFLSLISLDLQAQQADEYSRARIHFDGKSIHELAKLGIDISHGRISRGMFVECDFSAREILLAQQNGFRTDILIPNVGKYYESVLAQPNNRRADCSGSGIPLSYEQPKQYQEGSMGGYFLYEEMLAIFDSMATKYPNLILPLDTIGNFRTYEGRPILWTKLSGQVQKENDTTKRESLMTALHHSREPNSLSQMIYFLWYVLENYENDPVLKLAVDNAEFYLIPCINPDGYIYNQTTDPNGGGLWRKNRFDNSDGSFGVDLNRNYGYEWGHDNIGSSSNPGSDTYRGTEGFSEPETQAVKYLCEENDFFLALNYHTYGNLLIHPWGYNDQVTAEDSLFKKMARDLTRENDFVTGTGTETVGYTVNGDSDDWMYGDTEIYSFTPEAGAGNYGFWPPSDAIIPINDNCLGQNLVALFMTARVASVDNKEQLQSITNDVDSLYLNVLNYLPKTDSIVLNITSKSQGFEIQDYSCLNCRAEGESDSAVIVGYTVDRDLVVGDSVVLLATWTYHGQEFSKEFTYTLDTKSTCDFVKEYEGKESEIDFWETNTWGWTNEHDYDKEGSYTDSPNGNYANNSTESFTLKEPFDLSDLEYPTLSLYMKYDLEEGYDYVTIEGSSDGQNYNPICGNLSQAIGTQNGNIYLYSGNQNWVKEELQISDYAGSDLYLRFTLFSDGFINEDGMYIDNIKVENCPENSSTFTPHVEKTRVAPNPTSNEITLSSNTNILSCSIYNINGTLLQNTNHHQTEVSLPLTQLESGLYVFKIKTENELSIHKILIQH